MTKPQQQELDRSGKGATDQDALKAKQEVWTRPEDRGRSGKVPPENRSGHHPPKEQDKP